LKQISKSIRTGSKIFIGIHSARISYGQDKIMHQRVSTATASPKFVQIKAVAIVVLLPFYCFLHVSDNNSSYPSDLKAVAPQNTFDRRGVAPIDLLTRKQREFGRGGFNTAGVSADFGIPRFLMTSRSTGLEISATKSANSSVDRHVNSFAIISKATSVTTGRYYGPRRRPETNVDRIVFDMPVLAPMAFMRFCVKYPKDCETRHMAFRPRPAALTAERKAELATVNRTVNLAIRPQANDNGVIREEWSVSPLEGDCNDYAVTKRHELLARGWPSRLLLLAEVVIPSGEHHLVLVVRTRENDLVLDNLNLNVRPISQVHYQWIRAQQEKNPKFWSTVNLSRPARVAFNTR
jgi:predicted transglutaminase-like cysteine proteinase